MVIHTGNYLLRADAPSDIAGIAVFLKVLPPKDSYTSSMRYKLKSRSWPSKYLRTSLSVVKLDHVTLMSALEGPGIAGNKLKNMVGRGLSSSIQPSAASTEEVVTGLGTLQLIPDVTIMFNLSNEPCLKYGLSLIGDRGMNQTQWTSWRLKDEVIYFEHQMKRYELSREKETNSITQNSDNELDTSRFDKYRWARVLPKAIYNNEITDVPLPLDLISVLETQIDWDEIEWGPTSVRIRGKCFEITSIQFRKCTSTNQI